jgi:hypothetical protein
MFKAALARKAATARTVRGFINLRFMVDWFKQYDGIS